MTAVKSVPLVAVPLAVDARKVRFVASTLDSATVIDAVPPSVTEASPIESVVSAGPLFESTVSRENTWKWALPMRHECP